MIEMPLEFWNKLANQLVTISSLLGGFSIAVTANLMVSESNNRLTNNILKVATVASGCFLVTVFAMTKILMMTTTGFPVKVTESTFLVPRILGMVTFLLGVASLSIVIALSGWTKSRSIGIFTTIVGILSFLMMLICMT